jgi:O-antigen/teichoic acid export membrane protein
MRIRDRMRLYALHRGYPDHHDDYETTFWDRIVGMFVVAAISASSTLFVLPLTWATAAVWSESIAVVLWALPALAAAVLTGQYIGAPVADAVIGVEYADETKQLVRG